jgi:hypothetical protein
MAIDILQTVDIIEVMENFLERKRPSKEIRNQLDIGYKLEDQSIILFEIRPKWNKPDVICEYPFAKATFVKKTSIWKVYWMKADLKWHSYPAQQTVKNLKDFTKLVEEDKHHCFFG